MQHAAVQNRGIFAVGSLQNANPSSGPSNDRCTYRKKKKRESAESLLLFKSRLLIHSLYDVHDAPPKDSDEEGRISLVDILALHQ